MIALSHLRHRVVLEQPVLTPDAAGGATETFQPISTLWAAIEPINALSGIQDLSMGQTVTHRLTLRYRTDITTEHRLTKGTRIFEIVSIFDPDETKRILTCLTRERTA